MDVKQKVCVPDISPLSSMRKRIPYSSNSRCKLSRCKEIIQTNKCILGGSDENMQPVLEGMLESISRQDKTRRA